MEWDSLEHSRYFVGIQILLWQESGCCLLKYENFWKSWSQTLFLGGFAGLGVIIIGLSVVVTTLTGISMSAICTNGVVRGGKPIHLLMTASFGDIVMSRVGLMLEIKFVY